MEHVRKFNMKYRNSLLVALVIIFASCGGGGGGTINQIASSVTNGNAVFNMVPVGY